MNSLYDQLNLITSLELEILDRFCGQNRCHFMGFCHSKFNQGHYVSLLYAFDLCLDLVLCTVFHALLISVLDEFKGLEGFRLRY
jgi:hypothetical protein